MVIFTNYLHRGHCRWCWVPGYATPKWAVAVGDVPPPKVPFWHPDCLELQALEKQRPQREAVPKLPAPPPSPGPPNPNQGTRTSLGERAEVDTLRPHKLCHWLYLPTLLWRAPFTFLLNVLGWHWGVKLPWVPGAQLYGASSVGCHVLSAQRQLSF